MQQNDNFSGFVSKENDLDMIEQKITSLTAAPNHNIMGIFRNKQ